MRARLVPLYLEREQEVEMKPALEDLQKLLSEEAEVLRPILLGSPVPKAEAVILTAVSQDTVKRAKEIKSLSVPLLFLTTEYATSIMWDWEYARCLEGEGVEVYAPYNLERTRKICRILGLKRELKETKFLVFEKNPLEHFTWSMERFPRMLKEKFGIQIIKQPREVLARRMEKISEVEAERAWKEWSIQAEGTSQKEIMESMKLYLSLKEIAGRESVRGIGMPCWGEEAKVLNYTTACLAYTKLFEEEGILGACEGDTLSLATMFILNRFFSLPVMMSNVYPFLMKEPMKKHEKIDKLPEVENPEDCLLVAHCGYLGLVPRKISTEFTARSSVLDLFPAGKIAIDARLPGGEITLVKLHPLLNKIHVVEATLEGYAQFPHSDCRNGAVVRVKDGRQFANTLYSHHYCLLPGHPEKEDLDILAIVLDLKMEMA